MPGADSGDYGRRVADGGGTAVRPSRDRPRTHPLLAMLGAWLILLILSSPLWPHTRLRSSEPAAGAHLTEAPREVRLHFSEPIGLSLTQVTLLGPDNEPVALGAPVQLADSTQVVVVRIEGVLRPGVYQVVWQTAGRDGHPVRGRFEFTLAGGAADASPGGVVSDDALQGTAPSSGEPRGARHLPSQTLPGDVVPSKDPAAPSTADGTPELSGAGETGFSAESPLYALVRFIAFVATFGVTGAVAFHSLVLSRVARRGRAGRTLVEEIGGRPARVGEWFSVLFGVGLALRLVAQGYALGGGDFASGALRAQLTGTIWGWGWLAQGIGVVLAWYGFRWASRGRVGGWGIAALGTLALALTTGLSGHAAGVVRGAAFALVADAGHILGAGGWLGGLLLLVGIGVPAAVRVDERWGGAAVVDLVHAFSGMALSCAAVVLATGSFGAFIHLESLSALFGTGYGRMLLLKLALLGVVIGAGAYNYLRVRPVVGATAGTQRLRRAATIELAAGAVVLMVTAVLVALPTP